MQVALAEQLLLPGDAHLSSVAWRAPVRMGVSGCGFVHGRLMHVYIQLLHEGLRGQMRQCAWYSLMQVVLLASAQVHVPLQTQSWPSSRLTQSALAGQLVPNT